MTTDRPVALTAARDRLIVALDMPTLDEALAMAGRLHGVVRWFKVGMELYNATGPRAVEALRQRGADVFLDLKLHDIPVTVARTVRILAQLGAGLLNVHASGGKAMLAAAAEAAGVAVAGVDRPRLIAVTVLTSLDEAALRDEIGVSGSPAEVVRRWAQLARDAGLDGVVCSPHEIAAVKASCGAGFLTVTPGVRSLGADLADQKRVATPAAAIQAGGDYLVVGRPITGAADPAAAARAILDEMEGALPRV